MGVGSFKVFRFLIRRVDWCSLDHRRAISSRRSHTTSHDLRIHQYHDLNWVQPSSTTTLPKFTAYAYSFSGCDFTRLFDIWSSSALFRLDGCRFWSISKSPSQLTLVSKNGVLWVTSVSICAKVSLLIINRSLTTNCYPNIAHLATWTVSKGLFSVCASLIGANNLSLHRLQVQR